MASTNVNFIFAWYQNTCTSSLTERQRDSTVPNDLCITLYPFLVLYVEIVASFSRTGRSNGSPIYGNFEGRVTRSEADSRDSDPFRHALDTHSKSPQHPSPAGDSSLRLANEPLPHYMRVVSP